MGLTNALTAAAFTCLILSQEWLSEKEHTHIKQVLIIPINLLLKNTCNDIRNFQIRHRPTRAKSGCVPSSVT